jgi:hypothetical protein
MPPATDPRASTRCDRGRRPPHLVTRPEAREALARERRHRPERLGSGWLGPHRPPAVEAAVGHAAPARWVRPGPTALHRAGQGKGRGRPAPGSPGPVWAPAARRQGQRRAGTGAAGVEAGLGRCGMPERGPPAWAAAGRLVAALLGAREEAQDVRGPRGGAGATTTSRTLAERDAARARRGPQGARTGCEDPVAGRRGGSRRDGGRLRRRETTRGPQTTKGRGRSPGAWRAPTGWRGAGVEAAGTRAARVVPVREATRQGPAAVGALLRPSGPRLASTHADHGRFLAGGAPWRWPRVPRRGQA